VQTVLAYGGVAMVSKMLVFNETFVEETFGD